MTPKNLPTLLRVLSWSHFRREPVKALLTIFGMAMGIAVYLAIRLANENAWYAFSSSTEQLIAASPLQITSDSGSISEDVIPTLLKQGDLFRLRPLSLSYLPARTGATSLGSLQLLGLDPLEQVHPSHSGESAGPSQKTVLSLLAEPRTVFVSQSLKEQLENDSLEILVDGRWLPLKVLATLPANGILDSFGGFSAMMDISHFQDLLGVHGQVGSIQLLPNEGWSIEEIRNRVTPLLPKGLKFAQENEREQYGKRMLEAFQLNLNFLASISLFVGMLLIYNTASFSILKRRREFGILLSLGITHRTIRQLLIVESLLLGVCATVLGLGLGYFFAIGAISAIGDTVSALYLPVRVTKVIFPLPLALEVFLLGPVLSLTASLIPLRELASTSIQNSFYYQNYEEKFLRTTRLLSGLGVTFLIGSLIFARKELLTLSLYAGFISPSLLLVAAALLTPALLLSFVQLSRHYFRPLGGVALLLAADHIQTTLRRNSVSVAAMVMAIGMFLGVSIMIASFRDTVEAWIFHITKADAYISPRSGTGSSLRGFVPNDVFSFAKDLPEVADFDSVSGKQLLLKGREFRVHGVRFDIIHKYDRLVWQHPMGKVDLQRALERPGAVVVSETFAQRTGMNIGDELVIPGFKETFSGTIVNIFYDYSSDQGVVFLPAEVFEKLDGEHRKQGLSLYLHDPTSFVALREKIVKTFPDVSLEIRNNHQLRSEVLRIFDATFRITYALQAISLLVAGLTILHTILILLIERKREFAVMRAIGASGKHLRHMVLTEALLLGGTTALGGIIVGILLSLLLVFVINKFFFGWSVQFHFPFEFILISFFGTMLLAAISAILPATHMTRKLEVSYE